MTEHKIKRLVERFKAEVAAAKGDDEATRAFFTFAKAFAAERAAADYLALEEEARAALCGDDLDDVEVTKLRDQFMRRVGAVRADCARAVVEKLDHVPPEEREPHWFATVHFHELAFDNLLRTVRGEGRC